MSRCDFFFEKNLFTFSRRESRQASNPTELFKISDPPNVNRPIVCSSESSINDFRGSTFLLIFLSFSYFPSSDRAFFNYGCLKSEDMRILCSLETLFDDFFRLKICEKCRRDLGFGFSPVYINKSIDQCSSE